jgi:hypothetical protein
MSFPKRYSSVDPNAPKISKLYYIGLIVLMISAIISFIKLPDAIAISGAIHISLMIILIFVFAVTHVRKDLIYQKEKKEKQNVERVKRHADIKEHSIKRKQILNELKNPTSPDEA